jgi:beta-lactamase regulating signal transducer with metallopeptidase domain
MASEIVLLLAQINLAASAAILLALALRPVARRMFGARIAYTLWFIVPAAALAVLLPARTTSAEAPTPIPASRVASSQPALTDQIDVSAPGAALADVSSLLAVVWMIGVVVCFILLAGRQRAFIASMGSLTRERGRRRILRAAAAGVGPVIIGGLVPKIILPGDFEARFDERERAIILAHEEAHLRGRDPLINLLVASAQCVNWFNPLVHVAANALRMDQELACDASVMLDIPTRSAAMPRPCSRPSSRPAPCRSVATGQRGASTPCGVESRC